MATVNGAQAYGIDAGVIAEGKLADAILLDLNNERFVPNYNLISNWVYSADSRAIDTVICHGKILMQNGYVEGEEEIIARAREICTRLLR
jgi:5-methylthioadenosine/S-adenosylhomocysteine deaminase